ncbi:MAG: hypothetical protein ACP5JG_13490, partial [Anaerolineae bacterium]
RRSVAPTPEVAYSRMFDVNDWPHPSHPANENIATELAFFALGLKRPTVMTAFLETYWELPPSYVTADIHPR